MADAAIKKAPSVLRTDPLLRVIQASHNNAVEIDLPSLRTRVQNRFLARARVGDGATAGKIALGNPGHTTNVSGLIANGTTAGKLKTLTNRVQFRIGASLFDKAATDDLWDLSAFAPDLGAAEYQAVALYLDASGTATTGKGSIAASAAAAIAALPRTPFAKAVIGVFVAGPNTDWNAGGGLSAQGTIYNRFAPGQPILHSPDVFHFSVAGKLYEIVPTDDLWNLAAEIDTIANQYRGYRLMIDADGVASFTATADVVNTVAATAQASVRALLAAIADDRTKTVVAEIICGPSTDFSANAILAKTGALAYDGYSTDLDLSAYGVNWQN